MKLVLIATTDIPAGTYDAEDFVVGPVNLDGDTIQLTVGIAPAVPASPPPPPPVSPPPPPINPPPPPPPPVPAPTGTGIKGEVVGLGMAASYQDYSVPPSGATITSIGWDFGDGQTATGASGQHLYAKAGAYTVTETVTYSDGTTAVEGFSMTAQLVPQLIADGLSVLYQLDSNQFVESVNWNFGDGTNDTGAAGRHPYAASGTYTITGSVSYGGAVNRIDPFGPATVTV